MDTNMRDKVFEQYQGIVSGCIRRNLPLILALRLEIEDVAQELSIRLLKAIDNYDESRCPSLSAFLYQELQYEVLNMRRKNKPHGIVGAPNDGNFKVSSLALIDDIPAPEVFGDIEISEIINLLPKEERSTLLRKINGEPIRKRVDKEHLAKARKSLADYFPERKHEYAL